MDPPSPTLADPVDGQAEVKIRFLFASGTEDVSKSFSRDATVAHVKETLQDDQRRGDEGASGGDLPRLVWSGRMLQDEEILGEVFVGNEQERNIVHNVIVAAKYSENGPPPLRPKAPGMPTGQQGQQYQATTSTSPLPSAHTRSSSVPTSTQPTSTSTQPTASTGPTPTTSTLLPGMTLSNLISQVQSTSTSNSALNPTPKLTPNPGYIAAYEALFYYSFLATNAVYAFTGQGELKWGELSPRPLFEEERVKEAVERVLEVNGIKKDGDGIGVGSSSGGQEGGGEGGTSEGLGETEKEQKSGEVLLGDEKRKMDAEGDEYIEVEVNGLPYKLMIPDLSQISFEQKRALGRYASNQRIVKALQNLLVVTPLYAPAVPVRTVRITTSTTTAQTPRYMAYRRGYIMLRIPMPDFFILFAIWTAAFWSLIKVGTVLYMFTRGIPRDDPKFICLTALAVGWWVWDCASHIKRVRASRRRAREAERARARQARGAVLGRPQGQGRAREARPVVTPVRVVGAPGGTLTNRLRAFWTNIGIAYDRRVLRLFYYTPERVTAGQAVPTPLQINDRRIPGNDMNVPYPPVVPSAVWRYLLLPVILFFTTMVPVLDLGRRAAILERERHMRLMVEKFTREKEQKEEAAKREKEEDKKRREEASLPKSAAAAEPAKPPLDFFSRAAYEASRDTSSQDAGPSMVPQNLSSEAQPPAGSGNTETAAPDTAEAGSSITAGRTVPAVPEPPAQTAPIADGATGDSPPPPSPIMPRYLCAEAIAYYRRVIGTTERIDWEAERQAQAALLGNNGGGNAADDAANENDNPIAPAV